MVFPPPTVYAPTREEPGGEHSGTLAAAVGSCASGDALPLRSSAAPR